MRLRRESALDTGRNGSVRGGGRDAIGPGGRRGGATLCARVITPRRPLSAAGRPGLHPPAVSQPPGDQRQPLVGDAQPDVAEQGIELHEALPGELGDAGADRLGAQAARMPKLGAGHLGFGVGLVGFG